MKLPSPKMLAVNAIAVSVIGLAFVTQVRSMIATRTIESCPSRYVRAVALGVERGGQLLTASDIQAAAAGQDHGVMDNLTLTKVSGGPAQNVLSVTAKAGTSHPDSKRAEARGGMTFPWQPRALPQSVTAACLSYDLYLPATFEFGEGIGTLPGLAGSSPSEGAAIGEKFTVRFGWGNGGFARVRFDLTTNKHYAGDALAEVKLPRGRWVRVDQEIILNDPNLADGTVRFWLDGTLAASNEEAILRVSNDTTIETVLADVHFGGAKMVQEGLAIKDERILLSPFELRWERGKP